MDDGYQYRISNTRYHWPRETFREFSEVVYAHRVSLHTNKLTSFYNDCASKVNLFESFRGSLEMDEQRIQEQKELLSTPSIVAVFKNDGNINGGKVLRINDDGSITFSVDVGAQYSPINERELTIKPHPKLEYKDKNKFTKWKKTITTYIWKDNLENSNRLRRFAERGLMPWELNYLRTRHKQLEQLSKLYQKYGC